MRKSEWLLKYKKLLEKFPERKKKFLTGSSFEVVPLYTPSDIGGEDNSAYVQNIGYPGEFPYTRGVQSSMYRGRFWTMRQYAGFGDAEETNQRFQYLLQSGQTGLSIAFDLPTQLGYDSDDVKSRGEVGMTGVAIDSLKDMEILFKDIPVDKISTSMTINAPAAVLLAMYIVNAEKQGIKRKGLRGTIQNDILKEYVARGTYIFPPVPSMKITMDLFEFCSQEMPCWNSTSISGYHIRESGSDAAQEVGFTFANGIAYVDAAVRAGLTIDEFAPRLSFFFSAHNDFFEEVAKFRAARRLWANIMKNRFGATYPKSMMLRFHTQTGGSTLTAQQPDNNIVRVTMQALAAVLGGTQSLHTNSRDEVFALPTQESVTTALRTQQILAEESGITNTVDPLGGSYYVECLTDKIEKTAKEYIEKIDSMGGVIEAIQRGYIQKEIQDSSYRLQQSVENKGRILVGVNKYTGEEARAVKLFRRKKGIEDRLVGNLTELKKSRSQKDVDLVLSGIKTVAQEGKNLMPPIIEAVKHYASIGEICGVLRSVFGEHQEKIII